MIIIVVIIVIIMRPYIGGRITLYNPSICLCVRPSVRLSGANR